MPYYAHIALLVVGSFLFSSCAGSYQNMVVEDRVTTYREALEYFHEAEDAYLNVLFNLERYPDEVFLQQRLKVAAAELEQARVIVMQSRRELDDAVDVWEKDIFSGKVKKNDWEADMKRLKEGRVRDRPEWEGFQ
jgi:hypothetical protein